MFVTLINKNTKWVPRKICALKSTYFHFVLFPLPLQHFFFLLFTLAVSTILFALLLHQGKGKVG